ncbi:gliding motility-associated C-terminal domain-containing protein [Hymenobacter cellulosilyticus]|uniref:Gliding motility-associated C-terminal domain-containing protein n=1 Tax=Hymenobacter cellulosilyticus TaxID=2932248 RepID=A0A8T9PXH5_9BACT|nr:gliding motility-associated C-terminal domain-containing protein [Hymenobacter cellulosilyticus]UOQ70086.1 gliding motility-associated C-terminal domain-containing protein [Hymenobacter cellulosilyticus]
MSQWSLPNYRVNPVLSQAPIEEGFGIEGEPGCAGQVGTFRAYARGGRTLRQVTWAFVSDATQYIGLQIAPVFAQAGIREMRVKADFTDGTSLTISRTVTVPASPILKLRAAMPASEAVCGEGEIVLTATANMEGTLRWDDSPTTDSVRRVSQGGVYRVRFESLAGCTTRDSITITLPDKNCALPNIITPNGDGLNQRFVLQNYDAQNWDIVIYNRWGRLVFQQAGYRNGWQADNQPAGVYYYQLRHKATQQVLKGWLEVVR